MTGLVWRCKRHLGDLVRNLCWYSGCDMVQPNACYYSEPKNVCRAGCFILPGAAGGTRELGNPVRVFCISKSPRSEFVGHEGRGARQSGGQELARKQTGGANVNVQLMEMDRGYGKISPTDRKYLRW